MRPGLLGNPMATWILILVSCALIAALIGWVRTWHRLVVLRREHRELRELVRADELSVDRRSDGSHVVSRIMPLHKPVTPK